MLVNCEREVLLECSKCGKVNKFKLNMFDLKKEKYREYKCQCGEDSVSFSMADRNNSMVDISVNCFYCKRTHVYKMKIKEVACKNLKISCSNGKLICLIGEKIAKKENKENLSSKILEISLKKIYTLYESGKINCQCGSNNIIVEVFPNDIKIICKDCSCSKYIKYKESDDFNNLLVNNSIYLEESTYYV